MNKKVIGILSGILFVVVLAGGAFTAVRLITAQNGNGDVPAGAMVFEDVMDDGSGNPVTVRTVILPAAELPARPSEAGGILKRVEDNSYFVGTGSISVNVVSDASGETSSSVDHSGPEIEVVAGRDTRFYVDVTKVDFQASESKEQTIQQELMLVEQPETMPENAELQAWGEKRGDRVIADVIVYSEPR